MRIPTDKPLAKWIRELIRADKVHLFYQTKEWKELRQEVLEENHFECAECLKEGKITTSEIHVHHVNEIRTHPHLALSKYFVDEHGEKKKNLILLCQRHHNEAHDRFANIREERKESSNVVKFIFTIITAILCAVIVCIILIENNVFLKYSPNFGTIFENLG